MAAPTPEPWLDLAEAKDHLDIPVDDTEDDDELTSFLRRAEMGIVGKVGHVKLRTEAIDVFRRGGRNTVRVNACPIGEVVAVAVGGGATVPPADLDLAAQGWFIEDDVDEKVGIIRHTGYFPRGWVKVTYKPGRDPVPEDLTLASLELLRHLWKTQRGSLVNRPGLRGQEQLDDPTTGPRGGAATPMGFSFPNRVMQLLGPYILPAVQ